MAKIDKQKVKALGRDLNESTRLSWLWALLFGPIYYAANGLWSQAVAITLAGFAAMVFFPPLILFVWIGGALAVYSSWRERAEKEARKMLISRSLS